MINFTNEETKQLMATLKLNEYILRSIPEAILSEYSQDRILDALVNNITAQTLLLKKQIQSNEQTS